MGSLTVRRQVSLASSLLGITSVMLLLATSAPVDAAVPSARHSAPYSVATPFGWGLEFVNGSGKLTVVSPAKENTSSGKVTESLNATSGAKFGTSANVSAIGFLFPFTVKTSGNHSVGANWSVKWSSYVSGNFPGCRTVRHCTGSSAKALGEVWIGVENDSNGSVFVTKGYPFVTLATSGGFQADQGSRAIHTSLRPSLSTGISYSVVVWFELLVSIGGYGGATSELTFSTPGGGTLDSVWYP